MPETTQAPQQQQGGGWLATISRMLMMYMIFNFFRGKSSAPQTDSTGKVLPPFTNAWKSGEKFDLCVYVSESDKLLDLNSSEIVWEEKDLFYDWSESNNREKFIDYIPSENVLNNGSVFAHIFLTKSGSSKFPSSANYKELDSIYVVSQLNRYLLSKKVVKKNLWSGEFENPQLVKEVAEEKSNSKREILSYWKPNVTLNIVDDHTVYPRGSIPPQVESFMRINTEESRYLPVLFVNEFWLLREHLMEVNKTLKTLPLTLSFAPISLMKWQMLIQMEQSFQMQQNIGAAVEEESDDFKRMLVETNPYLLGLTAAVTMLHTIFDFLAFKNDIAFWKNKKSLEGMSVRTLLINTGFQVVIFLYLLDNDTSWVILISAGIGLLIEFWKVRKAVTFEVDWTKRIPIVMKDRDSYVKSKTKEYDEEAMKYLSWVLYPLVVGYSIYSLMYNTHKSWYSWILSSLTGCVYTFGFIMMTPQLFINYKLKSVAHLPWRTFMYKALNTFIDDLFAFIIKMPTLHRLSCFRDDIIFLIYLYQRWIYRVDYKRVNGIHCILLHKSLIVKEFGQGGEDSAKPDDNAQGTKEITAKKQD